MAVPSRGRIAGMARAMEQIRAAQTSLTRNLEKAIHDPSDSTDDAGEAVERLLEDVPTVRISQSDFDAGTYRIRESGRYLLTENVDFDPPEQPSGPNYPSPPYQLGFFAAITVEAKNVVIDLGGHTLRQSRRHALRQRFFSIIELSDQPFLRGQGPSDFGPDDPGGSKMCLIRNGVLGRSAHHGIHGNGPVDLYLKNLVITDFEVGGIHLSDPTRCTVQECHISKTRRDVPVRAAFSQAVFARNVLRTMDLTHVWRGRTGADILADVEREIHRTETEVLSGSPVTSLLFRNEGGLLDGNCYGMVVHKRGVAIGPLVTEPRPGTSVFLVDVCIEDILSAPRKVHVHASRETNDDSAKAYGAVGGIVRGPVGDVIDLISLNAPNEYRPTVLSETQFYIASFSQRGNVPDSVIAWAQGKSEFPDDSLYMLDGLDSMAHTTKGNMGLFLSGIEMVVADRVRVDGVENAGTSGELPFDAAMGTLATACSNVILRDSSLLHAKTCGADFRNGTRALLRAVRIAKTTVPVLRDETSLVRCEKGGHATLLLRE